MSKFMDALEKLSQTAGTILGGPALPAALEIGKDILNLIENAKEVVNTNDVPKLEAMRDELEPRVMDHADRTEAALRG